MDRETGNDADTDSEAETHAGGPAAAAETQPGLLAGRRQAATDPHDRADAGRPDDGSAEATTQPIAGVPGPGELQDAGGQQGRLQDAGRREDDGPESALAIVQHTTPIDLTPAGPAPATRAPVRRSPGRLTPPGRPPAQAGDQRLARPPRPEPAAAARRSQASRREQPAGRLVPVLRPIFPGLATDPRLPIWMARALAAAAVGVAVTIWQNWRLGLTAAAAVAILDIIYRSRTTSVIPAAVRVTSAQRRTRRRLALLRGRGYIALNARAIPGSDSVIDHLVIGPPGVFALDSERWDRRLPVRAAASGRLYHGPFGQEERLEHAIWEAAQASILLAASLGRPISVRPAMAIYGPTIPWTVASLREVDVLAGRRLRKYFRRQARQQGPQLDADQIRQIHAAAARALPPAR